MPSPNKSRPTPTRTTHTQSGTYPRARAGVVRPVLTLPNERLRRPSLEVDPHDAGVVAVGESLVATMRASPACVGLAAPQIGEPMRLFCIDVTGHRKARSCAGLVVLANPRVVERRGKVALREGCCSVPHLTGDVERAEAVTVEGIEPGSGRSVRVVADGIEARCLLHEIDHLDGLLFVERVADTSHLHARVVYR